AIKKAKKQEIKKEGKKPSFASTSALASAQLRPMRAKTGKASVDKKATDGEKKSGIPENLPFID
ncbi:MAG: hypothetical protein NT116_04530, partial [Candidatus Parcubacteria bacterium]|nr:hypothetical protein [Candidatus Parcubacteria bacterium]